MEIEEKIGRIVLFPLKAIVALSAIALTAVLYPFVVTYVLIKGEGPFSARIVPAFQWPMTVLAFNRFLSLGGLDNPLLTKLTTWLERHKS